MRNHIMPRAASLAGLLVCVAGPIAAQSADEARAPWTDRVSVVAHIGLLAPAGGSQLFTLLDDALTPGASALRPRMLGAELRVRLRPRWSLLAGWEGGGRTLATSSRVQPPTGSRTVVQQTQLDVTAAQYVGIQWQAWRWRGTTTDRARLHLGAGGGVARYQLRQWGEFVDVARVLRFEDDLRSSGRGGFGFASAAVEVPIGDWFAVQGDVRRQLGSAPMNADYASFDRLDLTGTRASLGVVVTPGRLRR
jgi:hypothetical protein